MAIDTVKVEYDVPKEGKEMVDAVHALVKHFLDKKPIAEITLLLPLVMAAVDGYDKIGAEVDSEQRDELAAYLIQKMLVLFPPKADAPSGEQPSDGVQPA